MILWSIQPKEVLSIIESGKPFRCDGRKAECLRSKNMGRWAPGGWDSTFHKPYKWMVQQMKDRGIQKDNRYPVWGWYKYYDSKYRPPPISKMQKYCEGQYRLKLDVPDELVLLSDWSTWHEPLNNMFCGSDKYVLKMMSVEENRTWSPEKLERLKLKSWQKVFDIDLDNLKDWQGVQACFPSIKPEYLIKAERI